MNSPARILQTLRDRDLFELASQVAASHHFSVEEICSGSQNREITAAKHDLWQRLRVVLYSSSAVARIFGVDPSTIGYATLSPPAIVEVVLDLFDGRGGESLTFRWRKKPDPFGVTDRHEGATTWFGTYLEARAHWDRLRRAAGAPSFVGRSTAAGEGVSL
jgi:hypothetical protein